MTFGLQCDEPTSRAILDRAAEGGVTFIDSADAYQLGGTMETTGRTEAILGKWLAVKRQNYIVATRHPPPPGRTRGTAATRAST